MRRDEPWDDQFDTQCTFAFLPTVKRPAELARFVESEVVEAYGPQDYLERLCATLQNHGLGDGPLTTILGVQEKVLANKAFSPYFVSSGVLRALCNVLERENEREVPWSGQESSMSEYLLRILRFVYSETSRSNLLNPA